MKEETKYTDWTDWETKQTSSGKTEMIRQRFYIKNNQLHVQDNVKEIWTAKPKKN